MHLFKRKARVMEDPELIRAIQGSIEENEAALIQITNEWGAGTLKNIMKYGVPERDADDVFFLALTALNRAVIKGQFNGEGTLRAYFNRICTNKCMDYFKKNPKTVISIADPVVTGGGEVPPEPEYLMSEDWIVLFELLISRLGEKCQKVLIMKKTGYSMQEIAKDMGWQQAQTARTEASKCRERLREAAEADPKIMNEIKTLL